MARLFRFFFTVCFIALIAGVLALSWGLLLARAQGPLTAEKIMVIEPNTGTAEMATLLEQAGVIRNRYVFILTTILKGDLGELQAGEYQFLPHINTLGVVNQIAHGQVYQHKLTIPEGRTSAEIIKILQSTDGLIGDVATIPPEGTLLPETYAFVRGTTRQSLINRMTEHMTTLVNTLWAQRPTTTKLLTAHQMVTLASIVEKETGIPAERPQVAAVFHNRLNMGMKLQSDPTVIYALTKGAGPLGRLLTTNDLETADSPYNTYMYPGLPPGPIANPGRASLQAVIAPAMADYLYFVANGSGGHAFSRTLAEHNANVARWRSLQKEQTQNQKAP